jgi:glycosyltransferase involved in cell wall biosynthesis
MRQRFKLSVVLPVFSEDVSVVKIVRALERLLPSTLHEILLIVSPRSTPSSIETCKTLANADPLVHFSLQRRNPGLGRAVRQGLEMASGTHVLMMDSDGEMQPEAVPSMVKKLRETGCDMVVGSRWIADGGVIGYDPVKLILNRGFQLLFQALFITRVHDLTLGFKILNRRILDHVRFVSDFHDIALETTIKPIWNRFKVGEVPVVWKARALGESKNSARTNLRYLTRAISVLLQPRL